MKCREERWGTLTFAIPQLLAVQNILRLGWGREKFQGNTDDKEGFIKSVDEAILSRFYWAYLVMQEVIAMFINSAIAFVEACPCHYHLQEFLGMPDNAYQQ
eukprot:581093-Karenia_brevis.AAC.1